MKYKLITFYCCVVVSFLLMSTVGAAEKEKTWWKKRQTNQDIYYPHKIHMQSMNEEGDGCMLCHTFAKNTLKDEKQLKDLTIIANEPLKAICHNCHLDDVRAPWRCNICHSDKTTIWPDDHNYDYIHQHNEDARLSENQCRSCHLGVAFCSNCHFRRGGGDTDYHPMAYQSSHGIDARMMASQCARCHNSFYCSNCHRNKK